MLESITKTAKVFHSPCTLLTTRLGCLLGVVEASHVDPVVCLAVRTAHWRFLYEFAFLCGCALKKGCDSPALVLLVWCE
jgi:hypothetical protein